MAGNLSKNPLPPNLDKEEEGEEEIVELGEIRAWM